jgi:hypothetical protein
MKRCTLLLLVLAASTLFPCCSHVFNVGSNSGEDENSQGQRDKARTDTLEYTGGVIDTVKVRKDPKGGWFGPKLRDVYMQGEDTPVLYCDSGPSFPTGKYVTIFYHETMSKPESSACKAAIAVLEGHSLSSLPRQAVVA